VGSRPPHLRQRRAAPNPGQRLLRGAVRPSTVMDREPRSQASLSAPPPKAQITRTLTRQTRRRGERMRRSPLGGAMSLRRRAACGPPRQGDQGGTSVHGRCAPRTCAVSGTR
jgi:hypothetical protein